MKKETCIIKKQKTGKPKPSKKTGNKKKNQKHTKHHNKHYPKYFFQEGVERLEGGGAGAVEVPEPDEDDDPVVEGGRGLLITDLEEDGPAAAAGLDVDDTILSVNGVRVESVEALRGALKNVKGPVEVVFISDDSGETETVTVKPHRGRLGITMEEVDLE